MTPHAEAVRAAAHELTRAAGGLDVLLDRIGDAGCVLLGESTHGTSEFYALRAHITRRLVEEKGFRAVAVEADWPDAYRAGCWARGAGDDPDAAAALGDLIRFPRWVWRNREVEAFLRWLREHNAAGGEVGFYGLDLPSPGAGPPCETQVVEQLVELPRRAAQLLPRDRHSPAAAHFFAEQNARLVRNAERHHRAMFRVGPESWNLRETHMAETLGALRSHLARDGMPGKVVVWAHNSHVGDARATEQAELGQLTLGQLAREAFGGEAVLVGLSTFSGTVTAASEWGGPATASRVGPAREDSSEALLHDTRLANFLLVMGEDERAAAALTSTRLQRAIGVIYRP